MNSVACDGTWLSVDVVGTDSATHHVAACTGALVNVDGGGAFGLPPITYDDANALLVAIGAILALVWIIRQMVRVLH